MDYSKQMKLVEKLVANTDLGIEWKPAFQENAFQVSFRDNTVQIRTRRTDDDQEDIVIDLINANGDIVETFTDVDLSKASANDQNRGGVKWYQEMLNLYIAARRKALGAEKVLDELIEDLDSYIPF